MRIVCICRRGRRVRGQSQVSVAALRPSVTEMFYQPYHRPPALSNPPPHTVLTGISLPLKPLARHDRPRRVEDVPSLRALTDNPLSLRRVKA